MRAPAVIYALAAAAVVAWSGPGAPAHTSDEAPAMTIGLFHDGALVDDWGVITLMAAADPIVLELRLGHWEKDGSGVPTFYELANPGDLPGSPPAFSMDVEAWRAISEKGREAIASRGFSSMDVEEWRAINGSHADPAPPALVNHGDGTAALTVDRSSPAGGRIHLAAGDVRKSAWIGMLPRPPAGYGDPDGPEQPPPRIAAQARQPLCADVNHEISGMAYGADPHAIGSLVGLRWGPISGVPPIEGAIHQDGLYEVPVGEHRHEPAWRCPWASFGTQAPQLLRLCEVPGHDRAHYYTRHPFNSASAAAPKMISPYTGYLTRLSTSPAATYAAAPGPYWE